MIGLIDKAQIIRLIISSQLVLSPWANSRAHEAEQTRLGLLHPMVPNCTHLKLTGARKKQ